MFGNRDFFETMKNLSTPNDTNDQNLANIAITCNGTKEVKDNIKEYQNYIKYKDFKNVVGNVLQKYN